MAIKAIGRILPGEIEELVLEHTKHTEKDVIELQRVRDTDLEG